jgi:microsomal epoxide hydrolase
VNFLPIISPPDGKELEISKLSKLEQEGMEILKIWRISRDAYAKEHGTRPATIGLVLSSNPVAMLAW